MVATPQKSFQTSNFVKLAGYASELYLRTLYHLDGKVTSFGLEFAVNLEHFISILALDLVHAMSTATPAALSGVKRQNCKKLRTYFKLDVHRNHALHGIT